MAIQAIDTTLNKFLNPQEDTIYTIPVYQREYSWGEKHCEDLINDIEENEGNNYFIGSIIWVKGVNEVIDGQQRLTSINLLLTALYNKMNSFESDEDMVFNKSSLKRMIVTGDKCRLVPQRQGKNKEDFEYLINSEILKISAVKPGNFGNRRISHNYEWFKEYISSFDKDAILKLFNKISGLTFISACVDDAQTAFTLFETMNNRGMPLSAMDLIKNSYLNRSKDTNRVDNWSELISILGDENNQEQFLRNNYNAFRAEYNDLKVPLANGVRYEISTRAIKSNVINVYSHLIERRDFYDFIRINALNNSLLTGEKELKIDISATLKEVFKNFRNANATSGFVLLLYLLRYQIPYGFSEEQMLDLFNLTLKFLIRRNLTNNPSTGAIPQILMDIIEKINQLSPVSFDGVKNIILEAYKSRTSTDDVVRGVISGDIYETNRDMARYLLCSLCEYNNNKEKNMVDLWKKKDKKYIWTIEHILPEGNKNADNIPDKWINMIKEGNNDYSAYSKDEVINVIKNYRHKIGNLTMTGYNSSLGQLEFSRKKDRYDENKNPIGYNNGISLNEYVYKQGAWYIKNIEERTNNLVDQIMKELEIY